MIKGTRVGQAYVSLVIDGDGMDEEIVHSVEDAAPGVEKAGEEHGKRYGEGFDRESGKVLHDEGRWEPVGKDAEKAGEKAGDDFGKGADRRLRDRFRGIGDSVGQALSDRLASKSKSVQNGIERSFGDDEFFRRLGAHIGGSMVNAINHAVLDEGGRGDNPIGALFDRLMNDGVSGNAAEKAGRALGKRMSKGVGDEAEKSLGDTIGKIFGKGSRNNFVNIVGSIAGGSVTGIEKLSSSVVKLFQSFGNGDATRNLGRIGTLFRDASLAFREGFSLAAQSGDILGGVIKGLVGAVQSVASSFKDAATQAEGMGAAVAESAAASANPVGLISLAATIAAVSIAAGLLITLINGLVAAITALTASITSGLIAALTIGAAGFTALGAAAGLTLIAFKSMDDAQKKALKDSFQPLHAEIVGIGQDMLTKLVPAFGAWSHNLQVALAFVKPLADVMGGAFARAGKILTASLSGPGFQMFLAELTQTLPGIVTNLTHAFGQFSNAMLAVFTPLLPYVLQFSQYLNNAANTFARWAESAKGQRSISDFFSRAVSSLHSIWNLLGSVGSLLKAVLFNNDAQKTGNSIFDSLSNNIDKFVKYLNNHKGAVKKWFTEGKDFADSLGNAIVGITQSLQTLNDPSTMSAIKDVTGALKDMAGVISAMLGPAAHLGTLVHAIGSVGGAIGGAVKGTGKGITDGIKGLANLGKPPVGGVGRISVSPRTSVSGNDVQNLDITDLILQRNGTPTTPSTKNTGDTISGLINSGNNALAHTTTKGSSSSSTKKAAAKKKVKFRLTPQEQKLLHQAMVQSAGPSVRAQMLSDLLATNGDVSTALLAAGGLTDGTSVTSSLQSQIDALSSTGQSAVDSARSALGSAASSLSSATNKKDAAKAVKQVRAAQKDLKAAQEEQGKINRAQGILTAQAQQNNKAATDALSRLDVTKNSLADFSSLVQQLLTQNSTLTDFAAARGVLAQKIQDANTALQNAIQLRDSYKTQIADSIKAFGALTTAQASSLNGITQALSGGDIVNNLQDRLQKIKDFQSNINTLIAQGASNDVIKQILDAGVDGGSDFASALAKGGVAAVQQVNDLTSQISAAGDALGQQASTRLYQAGVDTAQGFLDGLTSLDTQLAAAANSLGLQIAAQVKQALGIASPSKVAMSLMGYVGDGMAIGLDDQHTKVGAAADRLASRVAVSPEVARYAAAQGQSPTVSGNGQKLRDVNVYTTTEDPVAVAHEVLNEITGRL